MKVKAMGTFPLKFWASLFLMQLVFSGCQSKKEAPLSPAAAAFKREVRQAIGMLADSLVEPVSKANVPLINATLEKAMPDSIKLCRACPFTIAVLNRHGVVLTVYPQRPGYSRHYSDYQLAAKALEKEETWNGRLFLQDGTKLYSICEPLRKAGKVVGALVLTVSDCEVQQRWGISEEEFLALNFNR